MSTSPLVTVVVPTCDRAHLLPRLLRCLLGQELDPSTGGLEVVVVDDASKDGTTEVLQSCPDPRLRVVRHKVRTGVSIARNDGTAAGLGRWVAWCDDDDLWAPDKLQMQLAALAVSPGSLWCNAGAVVVDPDMRILGASAAPASGDVLPALLRRNIITGGGSGVLADRRLALHVGGFDPGLSIYADWHMWVRLAQESPLTAVDAPLVAYFEHPSSMSHDGQRLLAEYDALERRLTSLAAAHGRIDAAALAAWMMNQQVSGRSARETWELGAALRRRRMLRSWQVPSYLLRTVASSELREVVRPWRRSVSRLRSRSYRRTAERWMQPWRDAADEPSSTHASRGVT